jgi:adenine C2-methylase RlmN of 23S rRNA A2503 and tRNA A37
LEEDNAIEKGKEKLFGKTLNELIAVTKSAGLPGYSAKQIADWLYKKEISSVNEMTNLSKRMREILANDYALGLSDPVNVAVSKEGNNMYLIPGRMQDGMYLLHDRKTGVPGKLVIKRDIEPVQESA